MKGTVTVSARIPVPYKHRLEELLQRKSLGTWLQEVLDGMERVQGLEARAKLLESSIGEAQARLQTVEEHLKRQQEVLEQVNAFRRAGITLAQMKTWASVLSKSPLERGDGHQPPKPTTRSCGKGKLAVCWLGTQSTRATTVASGHAAAALRRFRGEAGGVIGR